MITAGSYLDSLSQISRAFKMGFNVGVLLYVYPSDHAYAAHDMFVISKMTDLPASAYDQLVEGISRESHNSLETAECIVWEFIATER